MVEEARAIYLTAALRRSWDGLIVICVRIVWSIVNREIIDMVHPAKTIKNLRDELARLTSGDGGWYCATFVDDLTARAEKAEEENARLLELLTEISYCVVPTTGLPYKTAEMKIRLLTKQALKETSHEE